MGPIDTNSNTGNLIMNCSNFDDSNEIHKYSQDVIT